MYGIGTNKLIKYFTITKNTYKKFKVKWNLKSPIEIYKKCLDIPSIPNYVNISYSKALDYIFEFKAINKGIVTSAQDIHNWILLEKGENVSIKMIRRVAKENPNIFKTVSRSKKRNYFSSNHNQYVRDDHVKNNYKTPNVVGIDGTYFRFYLKGKKNIISCSF
ncbi:hypothetical protein [Spiroplasma endosymbiont of Aspidapion aeneum]|uniref:hypothetical protein n=1 Tax=Spiroplasma endosymbiont of Aspidapion aeneum TaxID=3066276 RepID=UPI00313E1460